jgi:hypothetical protein
LIGKKGERGEGEGQKTNQNSLSPLTTTPEPTQGGDLLDWTSNSGIREDVFIQRVEALSTMGYTVMISNYRRYFKLAAYLSTFTKEAIVIAMGVPTLRELFRESHYTDLDGGLLEGFGRLLKFDLKIYVYPTVDPKTGELISASNLKVRRIVGCGGGEEEKRIE